MRLRDALDPRRHAACTVDVNGTVAAVVTTMTATGCRSCVVLDHGRPAGFFSAGDLVRCLGDGALCLDMAVRRVMTEKPLTAGIDDLAAVAATEMMRRGVHHLPVIDGLSVAGVMPLADVAAAAIHALQGEIDTLGKYIADLHAARLD